MKLLLKVRDRKEKKQGHFAEQNEQKKIFLLLLVSERKHEFGVNYIISENLKRI